MTWLNNQISGGGSVVVDFLFIVTPIVGVFKGLCCTLLYVHSSIAILMGKRELNLKLEISMRPVCLLMIFLLFTLLYLII